MGSLEAQQRGLLDLLKGRAPCCADPYLVAVARSPGLPIARRTALFWRTLQLESQCCFTCGILKRYGRFEAAVERYFDNNSTSPFVEELSRGFLRSLRTDDEPLVRAISQFEFAVLEVKSGSRAGFEIRWDRDPARVLAALDSGSEIPAPDGRGSYRMQIDRELDGLIACTREESASCATHS
jgi:hypothetical protein